MFLVYIATIFRAWVKRMTYYSLHTHHPVTVLLYRRKMQCCLKQIKQLVSHLLILDLLT